MEVLVRGVTLRLSLTRALINALTAIINRTPKMENSLIQFLEVYPPLNSYLTLYMLEKFGAMIKLKSLYPAFDLKVQIWTNALNKFNSKGNWHPIDLPNQDLIKKDTFIFQGSFRPTSKGNYQFTYRVGLKQHPSQWQWAGNFGENGYLRVEPPSPEINWTQGPSCVKILPHIYVGNFIAASQAPELGIDAVLNLTCEFPLTFPTEYHIAYKQLGLLDGAQNSIPDKVLLEAIAWIEEQLRQGKKKILINCRAGIGRSGSISLAYCFYKHRKWSYQKTLDYIWTQKADIYPHYHLQESLERLFPRELS